MAAFGSSLYSFTIEYKMRRIGIFLIRHRQQKTGENKLIFFLTLILVTQINVNASGSQQPGFENSEKIINCRQYHSVQACIDDTPIGGTAYLEPGTYDQSAGKLTITAKQLLCAPGAIINFTALPPATDMVTLGWSLDAVARTGVSGCILNANASGQDAIRINGGLGWFVRNIVVQNQGRDCIHLEPDASDHWSENSDVEDVHCGFTLAMGARVRDGINISLASSTQQRVFLNKGTWKRINIRGYKGNGIHAFVNNSCVGCQIATQVFEQIEDDAQIGTANTTPAVFFEKGPSGAPNEIADIVFTGSDFEDTAGAPVASAVFKQSVGVVVGLYVYGAINGNYPQFFDSTVASQCANNNVFAVSSDGTRVFSTIQWLKEGSGSQQFSLGMCTPGGTMSNDAILSMFNAGSWTERFRVAATGGINFSNASGVRIAQINNAGQINQGSAGTFAGASECVAGVKTITFPAPYRNPPAIFVFDETNPGGAKLSSRALAKFTVACTGMSDAFSWLTIGNPD
jgi:hypothetical protein